MKNKILYLSVISMVFMACEPEFKNEINEKTYSNGEVDFSSYVAIGNSLTSGYMDGTMFRSGQKFSFPNILSQQFKTVGGGVFTQPSYEDDVNDIGGLSIGGAQLPGFDNRLVILGNGPVRMNGKSTIDVVKLQAKAYHNMGIPGAKVYHLLLNGYGNIAGVTAKKANPYFVRQATTPNASVIEDAVSLKPTFFTNWIGANDVLAYAVGGGVGTYQGNNLDPKTYGFEDITAPGVFGAQYNEIVNQLTKDGAKGVLATIPNVTSIPFFTTVPFNPLTAERLKGKENIKLLNENLYANLIEILKFYGVQERLNILSETDANPILIVDKSLKDMSKEIGNAIYYRGGKLLSPFWKEIGQMYGQVRQATKEDLILLTAANEIGNVSNSELLKKIPEQLKAQLGIVGVTFPLEDKFVLTKNEIANIESATREYNLIIKQTAQAKKLALVDMNEVMRKLVSGLRTEDGQIYTANYFAGLANINTVLFSLDGVHPNARGYAFIANEIIKTINQHYKSRIPLVNVASYPGVKIVTSN